MPFPRAGRFSISRKCRLFSIYRNLYTMASAVHPFGDDANIVLDTLVHKSIVIESQVSSRHETLRWNGQNGNLRRVLFGPSVFDFPFACTVKVCFVR